MATGDYDFSTSQRLSWIATAFASAAAVFDGFTTTWVYATWFVVVLVMISLTLTTIGLGRIQYMWHKMLAEEPQVQARLKPKRLPAAPVPEKTEEIKNFCGGEDCGGHPDKDERQLIDMVTGRYICCGTEALNADSAHAVHCRNRSESEL